MTYTNENFEIYYNDCDKEYLNDMGSNLNEALNSYLDFFNLSNIPFKIKIKLYDKFEDFKIYYETTRKHPYKRGRVASTNKEVIHILSYNEYHKIREKDSLVEYIMCLKHELVHICYHLFLENQKSVKWFNEGLAICLGNPVFKETLKNCDYNEFINGNVYYDYYYTVVKYMMETLSHDEFLNYAKNPNLLMQDAEKFFNNAKELNNKKSI